MVVSSSTVLGRNGLKKGRQAISIETGLFAPNPALLLGSPEAVNDGATVLATARLGAFAFQLALPCLILAQRTLAAAEILARVARLIFDLRWRLPWSRWEACARGPTGLNLPSWLLNLGFLP